MRRFLLVALALSAAVPEAIAQTIPSPITGGPVRRFDPRRPWPGGPGEPRPGVPGPLDPFDPRDLPPGARRVYEELLRRPLASFSASVDDEIFGASGMMPHYAATYLPRLRAVASLPDPARAPALPDTVSEDREVRRRTVALAAADLALLVESTRVCVSRRDLYSRLLGSLRALSQARGRATEAARDNTRLVLEGRRLRFEDGRDSEFFPSGTSRSRFHEISESALSAYLAFSREIDSHDLDTGSTRARSEEVRGRRSAPYTSLALWTSAFNRRAAELSTPEHQARVTEAIASLDRELSRLAEREGADLERRRAQLRARRAALRPWFEAEAAFQAAETQRLSQIAEDLRQRAAALEAEASEQASRLAGATSAIAGREAALEENSAQLDANEAAREEVEAKFEALAAKWEAALRAPYECPDGRTEEDCANVGHRLANVERRRLERERLRAEDAALRVRRGELRARRTALSERRAALRAELAPLRALVSEVRGQVAGRISRTVAQARESGAHAEAKRTLAAEVEGHRRDEAAYEAAASLMGTGDAG